MWPNSARYHHTTLTSQHGPVQWLFDEALNFIERQKIKVLDFFVRWKASVVHSAYTAATNGHYHHLALSELSVQQLDNLIRHALLQEDFHNVARDALREMDEKKDGRAEEAIYNLSKLRLLLHDKERYEDDIPNLNWEIIQRAKSLRENINQIAGLIRRQEAWQLLKQKVEGEFDHIKPDDRSYTSVG